MDKIKSLLSRPLIAGVAGAVVGLLIGWLLIGWLIWPVEWTDADASKLRQDLKEQYKCMVVDSYKINHDANLAAARLDSLGEDIQTSPNMLDTLQTGGCNYLPADPDIMSLKSALMGNTTGFLQPTGHSNTVGEITPGLMTTPVATETKTKNSNVVLISVLCGAFLIVGAALVYFFFIRNKKKGRIPDAEMNEEYLDEDGSYANQTVPTKTVPATPGQSNAGPAAHFMTTYVIGDDLYDDSFSIDAQTGEFLGECGVGISETIGVGDPKKVTAFEVWLFDKNDIQTVTKVLMSSHAMNDAAIRQRLASKGDPLQVEAGQQILLETATLQLEARVIELVYGQGALPAGSFFERLTLEIAVWPK